MSLIKLIREDSGEYIETDLEKNDGRCGSGKENITTQFEAEDGEKNINVTNLLLVKISYNFLSSF